MPTRIAIVGFGKIARDSHVPALAGDPRFELVAVAGPHVEAPPGLRGFKSHIELIAAMAGELDAVAICTPPAARPPIARDALAAGLHVLLEKPPAATLGALADMIAFGHASGRTLFAAWHSQHGPAVAAAAAVLAGKPVHALAIEWREDVRKWHPGQEWIWAAGGFGVFDTGINALSIATRILGIPLVVEAATLSFPANRQAPIAASLVFAGGAGRMGAEMDWRHDAAEVWTMRVETGDGTTVELTDGGAALLVDGARRDTTGADEYASIYDRFAALIESGASDIDREPLRIVADAFLVGERRIVEPFAS